MRFQYHRGNFNLMRRDLVQDWDQLFSECADDPEEQLSVLTHILRGSQTNHVPMRDVTKSRTTRRTPLDTSIRAEIRKKHRLWERFMADRTNEKRLAYTKQRNQVRKMTRRAKKIHESNLADQVKDNPKKFWGYAKSKLKTKQGIAELERRHTAYSKDR